MPEELSRAEKIARADMLRAEVSSLRIQAEQNAAVAAADSHDASLDLELKRLEQEVAEARLRAEASGSVSDAEQVMAAAAAAEEKAARPITDKEAEAVTPVLPVAEEPAEKVAVVEEPPVKATPTMVAKKANGGSK